MAENYCGGNSCGGNSGGGRRKGRNLTGSEVPPNRPKAIATMIARQMKEERTGQSPGGYFAAKRANAKALIEAMRNGDEEGVVRAFEQFDRLRG